MILAKSREKGEITLKNHISNLLQQSEELLALFSQSSQNNLKKLLTLAIVFHDLGKVLPYYQRKVFKNENYWERPPQYIPHSLLSLFWIDIDKLFSELGEADAKLVLTATAFHHWRENFFQLLLKGDENLKSVLSFLIEEKNCQQFEINLKEELNEWADYIKFNKKLAQGIINGLSLLDTNLIPPPYLTYFLPQRIEIPEESKKRQILITGLLQRIDGFASFLEEDKSKGEIEIRNIPYNEIKERVLREIQRSSNTNLTERDIWQFQKVKPNENLILVAPTSYGKTEFAFLWANGQKMLYTLPLRVAVNQIFQRAKRIFGEGKIGILHSDADLYLLKEKRGLEEGIRTYEISKHLSYPNTIATGDQFFPSALKYPTYEKIYATLSYSHLVIDEVQAYDPRACAIIVKLLEDITRLGGKFLLMTATLPEFVRKEIESRCQDVNYQLINLYEEDQDKFRNNVRHNIKFKVLKGKPESPPRDLIEEIINKAKAGNRVLVIVNTVKMAQEIFVKLENDVPKWLIHSRFTQSDRQRKEREEIENQFGHPKPDNENEAKIIVSTQVVEASLNIDADYLFTELAPLDALIQRMGRVWRRIRADKEFNYSQKYKDENVTILVWEDGLESGEGNVYEKDLLVATLMILSSKEELKDEYWLKKKKKEDMEKKRGEIIKQLLQSASDKEPFCLSEFEKQEYVIRLFNLLPEDCDYLKKFYETLSVLDAGYVSERKREAERTFREIYDVNVISEDKLKDFGDSIKNFFNNEDKEFIKWTFFKDKVLSKFVVPCPIGAAKGRKPIFDALLEQGLLSVDSENGEKLRKWLEGVYVIEAQYDENKGLIIGSQREKNSGVIL